MKLDLYKRTRQSAPVSSDAYPLGTGTYFYEGQTAGTTTVSAYSLTAMLLINVPLIIDGVWFDIPTADSYLARFILNYGTQWNVQTYLLSSSAAKSTGMQFFSLDEGKILLLPKFRYYLQVYCATKRSFKGANAAFNGTYYRIPYTYYDSGTTAWTKHMPIYLRGCALANFTFPLTYVKTSW